MNAPSTRVADYCSSALNWCDDRFGIDVLDLPRTQEGLAADCAPDWTPDWPGGPASITGARRPRVPRPSTGLGDAGELVWFRWIVGHQTLFMVWRLLSDALRSDARGVPREFAAGGTVEELVDLCSALFLYSGSCSSATYLSLLRPAMEQHHPAFSGTWASDYQPIPAFIRLAMAHDRISAAWRAHQRIHVALMQKLVPGQPSLLRKAGGKPSPVPTEAEASSFDSFFVVRRRRGLCRRGFAARLAHWLSRVAADIEEFGLYYDSPPLSQGMAGEQRDRTAELETSAVAILTDRMIAVER
jgi:hypothetical protein